MSAKRALRLVTQQRLLLAEKSLEIVSGILPAYRAASDSIVSDNSALNRLMTDAINSGEVVDAEWLTRNPRFSQMIFNYESAVTSLDDVLTPAVVSIRGFAASQAITDSAALVQSLGFASTNPVQAASNNLSTNGSWMARLAPQKANSARKIILDGVAKGRAPSLTARLLAEQTDTSASHALTVVRTEQLRAYRDVTHESYVRNSAVTGWRWSSRRSPRTCSECWSNDGEQFSLDNFMDSHPRCMCAMLPIVEGVDYGATGREVFTEVMTVEQQRSIIGKSSYESGKSVLI